MSLTKINHRAYQYNFLILKWSPKMVQNINKLKFNKEEFKNPAPEKLSLFTNFLETNQSSNSNLTVHNEAL